MNTGEAIYLSQRIDCCRRGPANTGCPAMACFGGEPRPWTPEMTPPLALPGSPGHPGGRGLLIPGRGRACLRMPGMERLSCLAESLAWEEWHV